MINQLVHKTLLYNSSDMIVELGSKQKPTTPTLENPPSEAERRSQAASFLALLAFGRLAGWRVPRRPPKSLADHRSQGRGSGFVFNLCPPCAVGTRLALLFVNSEFNLVICDADSFVGNGKFYFYLF